jgi:hypothetical protein
MLLRYCHVVTMHICHYNLCTLDMSLCILPTIMSSCTTHYTRIVHPIHPLVSFLVSRSFSLCLHLAGQGQIGPSPILDGPGFVLLTFSKLISMLATRIMSQQPTDGVGIATKVWTRGKGGGRWIFECG